MALAESNHPAAPRGQKSARESGARGELRAKATGSSTPRRQPRSVTWLPLLVVPSMAGADCALVFGASSTWTPDREVDSRLSEL